MRKISGLLTVTVCGAKFELVTSATHKAPAIKPSCRAHSNLNPCHSLHNGQRNAMDFYLPPLETLKPDELKNFSKEQLVIYLDSAGMAACFV